jgi:hypothetical protein
MAGKSGLMHLGYRGSFSGTRPPAPHPYVHSIVAQLGRSGCRQGRVMDPNHGCIPTETQPLKRRFAFVVHANAYLESGSTILRTIVW